ncbi:aminopeptidase [Alkalihalobacillus sp. FSL R5-0424]
MLRGIYEYVNKKHLEGYAELAVRLGVNVQKDQFVIIHSDIEHATFARLIQRFAYESGASNVWIDWTDEQSTNEFYVHAAEKAIDHIPNWQVNRFSEWNDKGAAYIHIRSERFESFEDIPSDRISRYEKAYRTKLQHHYEKIRSHEIRWCILAVPTFSWAKKVFPHLPEEQALRFLWQQMLHGARANGDNPTKEWESHNRNIEHRKTRLNKSQFTTLHFKNTRGTDLTVGLPQNHIFLGGSVRDREGIPFLPNIPTEEIFTAPHKHKVNGKLIATKPLIYGGSIIHDVSITFKNGRIIDYDAASGKDVLQSLIEADEGSQYLGEIALVSNQSPLAQTNTLFYNTLFDENTACHIGIGNASPSNLHNGHHLSSEELEAEGLNTSVLHVNVAFGTEDISLIGINDDGEEVLLMKQGEFKF